MNNKPMKNNFLDTDWEDIEASFLPPGVKITDLPIALDNRVPASDVLLSHAVNYAQLGQRPGIIKRLIILLRIAVWRRKNINAARQTPNQTGNEPQNGDTEL